MFCLQWWTLAEIAEEVLWPLAEHAAHDIPPICTALRLLGERPELQQLLRQQRDLIANDLEEVLRIEPPVKCNYVSRAYP